MPHNLITVITCKYFSFFIFLFRTIIVGEKLSACVFNCSLNPTLNTFYLTLPYLTLGYPDVLLSLAMLFDHGCPCTRPPVHYSLQYIEDGSQELHSSVVLTLLNAALLLEDRYEYALPPFRLTVCAACPWCCWTTYRVSQFQTDPGIPTPQLGSRRCPLPSAIVMPLSALSVSALLIGVVSPWVGLINHIILLCRFGLMLYSRMPFTPLTTDISGVPRHRMVLRSRFSS